MKWWWTYLRSSGSNFHTVVDGQLYRSATPSVRNIRKWAQDPGINTFVDLRMPSDYSDAKFFNAQCAALREVGIRRISLPCSDRTPLPESTIETFLEIATNPSKYGKVLVACKGGRHRAGAMVAFYRVRVENKNACAAYEEAKDVGGYYPNGHEVYDLAFRKLLGALLCCLLLMAVPATAQTALIRGEWTSRSEYAAPAPERTVICPVCEEAGKKSTVRRWTEPTTYGFSYTPSINYYKSENRYWDEDGKYHDHELAQEMLICSAGHRFWDFDDHRCWCEWPHKRYVVVDEVKGETITLPELKKSFDNGGITYTPNGAVIMPMSCHPYIQPERTLRDVLTVQSDSMAKTIEPHRPDQRFDRSFWIASGLFAAASTADIITTHKALERGAVELNPFFAEQNGAKLRTSANALAATGIWAIAAYCEKRGHRRFGRILLLTGAAIRTAAAFWNHTRRR